MSVKLHYNPDSKKQLLVEFCNGNLVDGTELVCKLYQHKNQNHTSFKDRKKLFVKGKHVNYLGNNYTMHLTHPYACKFALAKINRRTMSAQIYEADVFKLRPIVLGEAATKSAIDASTTEANDASTEKSYKQKNFELAAAFGSTLSKQMTMSARLNDHSQSTALTDVGSIVKQKEFFSYDDDFSRTTELLPFNRSAESKEDLYPIFDLIPSNVFYSISGIAEKFVRPSANLIAKWKKEKTAMASPYILKHLENPGSEISNDDDLYIKYIIYLLFLSYISRILTFKSNQYASAKQLFGDTSDEVEDWFKSTFFSEVRRRRTFPLSLKDKAVATAFVLMWHLDSFNFDFKLCQESFDLKADRCKKIVQILGGELKNDRAKLHFPPRFVSEFSVESRMKRMLRSNRSSRK